MRWELQSDDVASDVWDGYLVELGDVSPFQCHAWGEFKRHSGWVPLRWIACNGRGDLIAMVQAIFRVKLGAGMLWSSGGPLGDISALGEDFQKTIRKATNRNNIYFRIFPHKRASRRDQEFLVSHGWHRCSYKLRSGMSMWLALDKPFDEIKKGLSKDWKKNLKRSQHYHLTVSQWAEPDVDEILDLYRSMEAAKSLKQQFTREEIQGFLRYLSGYLAFYRCDDEKGNLVALRGCVILSPYGWDLMAATSPLGRKTSASYLLLWEVLKRCQDAGVIRYDLMGIDPEQIPGVYHFKKGTGAEVVEYLGEWEWATSAPMRWCANWALRFMR